MQHPGQRGRQQLGTAGVAVGGCVDLDHARIGPDEPPRRPFDKPPALDQHLKLDVGVDLVVERFDLVPERLHVEHPSRHGVAAGEDRHRRSGLLAQPEGEC